MSSPRPLWYRRCVALFRPLEREALCVLLRRHRRKLGLTSCTRKLHMSTKILNVKFLKVRCNEHKFPDGVRQINLQCMAKDCPHQCAAYFRTPAVLWCVPLAILAERLCSQCGELGKLVREETEKRGGPPTHTSLAKKDKETWASSLL